MATTRSRLHNRVTTAVRRHRRIRVAAVITAAATIGSGLAFGLPDASTASPTPTIHEVEARIAAINTQAEKITEAYDGARDQLKTIQGKATAAHATLMKDEQSLDSMRRKISKLATAAYESAGLTGATSLLDTGNPELVIERTGDLGAVAHARQVVLTQAVATERRTQAAKTTYDAQVKAEKATVASIASKQKQIQALLGKEKQILSTLKAQQRRELAEQAARAHARDVAERQHYTSEHSSTEHTTSSEPSYNGPATGSAAAAVAFAYAQLGKPYVYGAAGPDSYDCSGLTMASWAAAGVSLPHNAAAQQATVPSVSVSDLQPGDLVFFGDPAYHVAIYIGGGNIIQAPHTGADVEITPLSYMPPTSAGRP